MLLREPTILIIKTDNTSFIINQICCSYSVMYYIVQHTSSHKNWKKSVWSRCGWCNSGIVYIPANVLSICLSLYGWLFCFKWDYVLQLHKKCARGCKKILLLLACLYDIICALYQIPLHLEQCNCFHKDITMTLRYILTLFLKLPSIIIKSVSNNHIALMSILCFFPATVSGPIIVSTSYTTVLLFFFMAVWQYVYNQEKT